MQSIALMMLLKKTNKGVQSSLSTNGQASSVLKVMDSYNRLTAIRWYTDMMINEEAGPLNIAQIQFLNKIAEDSDAVLAELESASKDLRSSISCETLMKEAKKGTHVDPHTPSKN